MPNTVLFVFGTRPEAIKLCPLVRCLRRQQGLTARVCVTAQHRDLLDQVLAAFDVQPDWDLNLMTPGQSLNQTASRVCSALDRLLAENPPDLLIVQGDTTTTMAAALSAFHVHVPVAHVEAGLRTYDYQHPFPEEMNRVLVSRLASLHFAATPEAAANLRREGIDETSIVITGNPGIDALLHVVGELAAGRLPAPDWPDWRGRQIVLVTAHRRENFGERLACICQALHRLAARGDTEIVYPVHPNPNVARPVRECLEGVKGITLLPPLDYVPFVDLMRRASILLTDSGGIQEEGPSLAKPVLVMRDKTERTEAVDAGAVKLVGADPDRIVAETARLLDSPELRRSMIVSHNPFGDGRASARISAAIHRFLSK